jgi:hypothetical protein
LEATVTRIEITRHAAADPASVALLLAEPIAQAPVRRIDAEPTGEVRPVHRSGVGFAAGIDVVDREGRAARGLLTVVPAVAEGCDVRITLSPVDDEVAESAAAWATAFLDSLAERARLRSSAA